MGSKLESQIIDQLKQCCKDEASFSKLEEIFGELYNRYQTVSKQISLLEQAIKNDYDSILVTELNLERPGPKIVYVNEGFTRMTGYSKEEVIGKTPRILQGKKTDEHVLERLKKRLIEGQTFFGHTVNYKKDGTEFINQWDIHPLTNNKGKITHWVSYQRDITERKDSDKIVFDAKLDFESLAESSKKTFVDIDVQGNILSANHAFRELLSYDADELKQIKIWDLVTDEDQDEMRYLFEKFDEDSIEKSSYPWDFKAKDGKTVKLEGNINYFVTDDETVVRIHFDNLSMRNRIIETLKKKRENLESILNKRDEFTLRFKSGKEGFKCKFASEAFSDITGLDTKLILDQGVKEVLHHNDLQKAERALKEAFEGKCSTIQCKYKTSEGNYISIIQSFKPSYDASDNQVESVKSVGMIELEVQR